MRDFDDILSPAGQSRRDEILALAKQHARQRRRRRQLARWAAPVVAVACMIGVVTRFNREQTADPTSVSLAHFHTNQPAVINVARIPTDPNITARLAVKTSPRWERIDDDELIHSLADAGQPAGLIQMKDRAVLVTTPDIESPDSSQ